MSKLFFVVVLLCSISAWSEEQLGELRVDEILIKPQLIFEKPRFATFDLTESNFSFSWLKDSNVGAYMKIGSSDLLNQATYFNSTYENNLTFVEAYAQISGYLGRLRMGMIPLEYGVEGSTSETDLIFDRSLLFERKVMALRDLGLSYKVSDNGYYTSIAVHNGESDDNEDGRMFVTASWGWTNYRNLNVGMSGQTGSTKPLSTNISGNTLAGVDNDKEAKWRIGNLYVHWHPNNWDLLIEANLGDLVQEDVITGYNAAHIDFGYNFSKQWAWYWRYDHFDPNEEAENDIVKQASTAIVLRDKNNTSNVYFIYTKTFEENSKAQQEDDEIRLVWRLTPLYRKKN